MRIFSFSLVLLSLSLFLLLMEKIIEKNSQRVDKRLERSQFLRVFRFQLRSLPHHRLDAGHRLADLGRAEGVGEALLAGPRGVALRQEQVLFF